MCNSTHGVKFYRHCLILHTVCNFTQNLRHLVNCQFVLQTYNILSRGNFCRKFSVKFADLKMRQSKKVRNMGYGNYRCKQQKWKRLQCSWKYCNLKKSFTSFREGGKLRHCKVKHEPVERNRIKKIKIFDKYLHFCFFGPFHILNSYL